MMALLAGSKLAINTLQLTAGSTLLLPQIFPRVAHIARFNLRADVAGALLDDAEQHLTTMAVPYVLALHEDYMLHCGGVLLSEGAMSQNQFDRLGPKGMHETFAQCAQGSFSVESLELFHLVRTLRNSQIHEGGRVNDECSGARSSLTPSAISLWEYLTKEIIPAYAIGDAVDLRQPQLIACLAITNRLMDEANSMLQTVVPVTRWAEMAIGDAIAEGIDLVGNPDQRFRKLKAFARRYYGVISVPDADLRTAASAAGLVV